MTIHLRVFESILAATCLAIGVSANASAAIDSLDSNTVDVLRHQKLVDVVKRHGVDGTIIRLSSIQLPDTIDFEQIWYIDRIPDSIAMLQGTQYYKTPVASIALKAVYWLWLLERNEIEQEDSLTHLVNIANGFFIYDYYGQVNEADHKLANNRGWQPYLYLRYLDWSSERLKLLVRAWLEQYSRYGLPYLQENGVHLLGRSFRFE